MKSILCIIYFLLISTFLFSQEEKTITGEVTDINKDGLPGVSIIVKGASNGTITDLDGKYSIEVNPNDILLFKFMGYESQETTVGDQEVINITLVESLELVDEVVVIGYGQMKKGDLTSAMVTLKSDELVKAPVGQAMQSLQGKVAGVQIINAGAPGGEPTVRIRGLGSFPGSSDSKPLYVVDGMYFDNIDFLNPSDIETISVLKDASASAIYGVRAANGVVLITTKNGNLNSKSTITYSGYYGIQVPQNVLKMANSEQFVNYINQTGAPADLAYIDNAMQQYGRSRINPNIPDVNTDWYAEIMKAYSQQQNHSLSISGGNEKTAYSLGMSYFEQEGLLKTENSFKRMNLRLKLDHKVNKWFKAGLNTNLSNATRYLADDAAWFNAYHAVPIMPVFDDKNYDALLALGVNHPSRYSSAQIVGYREPQNPLIPLAFKNNRQNIRKIHTGIYGQLDFIPNKLVFKTSYNISLMFLNSRVFDYPYFITNSASRDVSGLVTGRTTQVNQFLDNTLTYTESFGEHNLTVMAGTSYRDEWYDYVQAEAKDIPLEENAWYINKSNQAESINGSDGADRLYGLSYFGRLAYNYKKKYVAYFTLRHEGTSKYQEKWGTFPAFGLGWVISEENFFKGVSFVDYLKIRGGWGKLGNDKIARQDGANTTDPIWLAINDIQTNGTKTTSTFGYLGWETVTGTNVGLSAALFGNRLNIEADYYVRDTENAAIPVKLKLQPGTIIRNVGSIRNSGLEVAVNWNGTIGSDIKYNIGANVYTNKNEVTDIYGQEYINAGTYEFRQRSQVGEPLLSFYGYEVAGVYQNQQEIEADQIAIDNGLVPGDFKYVDQDGNGEMNDDDKVFLGSYIPSLVYGANLGLSYKNIEFSMNIMGQMGNKILNRKRGEIIWTNDANIDAELATNLWNGEGTSNTYPSASGLRRGWNQNFSDYLLEDGSFFRIQNVQLAYNLKGVKFLGADMPDTRIYFTAEKPLTLFKYNGFTPEVPDGIDRQFYPVPAIYTFGLNLTF